MSSFVRRTPWALAVLLTACPGTTPSNNNGPDLVLEGNFGQQELATLETPCEGIATLTGQSILEQRVEHFESMLSYVTAQGQRVDPTMLTVDITWPAAPVALCFPAHEVGGNTIAGPRVAITGLTLRFRTADGSFDETLAARAWRTTLNGNPQAPIVLAVTTRAHLTGTWQPFPEYDGPGSSAMHFAVGLSSAAPTQAGGNVGLSTQVPAELNAAILRGSLAIALWP